MASNRESTVLFFKDLNKTLKALPDADAGVLMKALFAVANGEEPNLEGSKLASVVFPLALDQMQRLEDFRSKQAARRSRREQNDSKSAPNANQNEPDMNRSEPKQTASEPNGSPYPYPSPYPIYKGVERSPKIQKAYGFSTERQNVDYNEIARQLREAAE